MKDFWVRLGCFMTGYNYMIVRNSSEATAKAVKKYLSALLIVCTLWGFVGYAFTRRYLHGEWYISLIGALIMVLMVIQIERQIILSIGRNRMAYAFRVLIGIVMAVLGSVILDQIIFKDDVNKIADQQYSGRGQPAASSEDPGADPADPATRQFHCLERAGEGKNN
jgi:hypothetical protein